MMKYLLVLGVVLVALWIWRNNRRAETRDATAGRAPLAPPQDMVRCPVCSVHLPRADALVAPDGRLYCSQEHRLRGSP